MQTNLKFIVYLTLMIVGIGIPLQATNLRISLIASAWNPGAINGYLIKHI